jgi:hypothetical protein
MFSPKSSGKEGTVLLAKPHCRNSLQRSQAGALATPASGSRGPAPGTLRSLLSLYCSNSRRVVQQLVSGALQCAEDKHAAFASVRLCECEPGMMSGMKSAGTCYSFKILAKIAASQGWQHPVQTPRSLPTKLQSPTGVFRSNGGACGLFVRASAQSFSQICIRAEARRGYFPPLSSLILGCIALAMPRRTNHQTGPP